MPAQHLFDLTLVHHRDRVEQIYGITVRSGYARAISYGSYVLPDAVEFYDPEGRLRIRYDYNDETFTWDETRKDHP